jgi:two-component system cell cycle response regulator
LADAGTDRTDRTRRRGDTPRILVVDDNRMVRLFVAERLRQDGYAVAEAQDGAEALESFRRERAHVVIADVGMPRLGGLELLAELRREQVPPEVILLTGSHANDAQAAVQALRLGAHDYIVKDLAAGDALRLAVERAAEKWHLREENARLLCELRRLSLTDGLTGTGNRRAFDDALRQESRRALGREGPLALAIFDIDHFKRVNDSFGHDVGDRVLVSFARRLESAIRERDRLFRYGGEEFAVLGQMEAADALALARRAVTAVASRLLDAGGRPVSITCSAGVGALLPTDTSGDELLARADQALYAAKRQGRNRAVCAGEVADSPDARCGRLGRAS